MTSCRCMNTKLELGGWMGPTPQYPYPRPCQECSPDMGIRDLQNAYARYLHKQGDTPTLRRNMNALQAASAHRRSFELRARPPF